mmetsp:Transcript_22036/g.48098  ORF Transcript_22036/g.48098 Transcript_22036/m.48098 type:complete len:386 (-) Transcript_22036:2017-3174(-)|eukprot:CAMPEP_0202920246 /NCGR_PEP_ID=MMETSP1392-20130828/76754_1 /ASSEMBLY_ACC=CAM_ASM_000868 /TAXON_ID=225041 /ORGANISM="Chlamydomonas chlamydogama, Strain SAG 11-48b" /LENGTH=385 /DNA_ID=CAMNT_0049613731 /DNA_START=256 /DNA_END=1413 /DNA_ORIENTATION=+
MASMLYQHLAQVVGVVGAGQMGAGIAQILVQKGIKVILSDRRFDIIEKGIGNINKSLEKQIKAGKITPEDATAAVGRIETAVSLEPFRKADFVIEAAPEDEEIKKTIFRKLDQVTPVQTILASNTSSISITRLAAVTSKPHRVVGMHFMHPVVSVPLVELAKGMHTSNQTFESTKSLCQHLGKNVCVSEDRPGFILYRVLMPMINEAFFCMMEGVGTPDDIDKGMKLGTNMALGPLKLADSIGLDTCLSIMKVLHQQFGDSKYRPCPLLSQYVDGGWLGVKTGKGVFYYEPGAADKAADKAAAVAAAIAAHGGSSSVQGSSHAGHGVVSTHTGGTGGGGADGHRGSTYLTPAHYQHQHPHLSGGSVAAASAVRMPFGMSGEGKLL